MSKSAKRFHIYINKDAGTVSKLGRDSLETLITESGISVEHLYFLNAQDLIEKLKDVEPNVPVLIGGGDGTIRSCAEILLKKKNAFGILPLGTMNLLANDLDIPVQIDKALAAYARGIKNVFIDAGLVNQKIFLCCAGYGVMPEASRQREQHRSDLYPVLVSRLTAYVLKQMDRMNRRRVDLKLDNRRMKVKTAALVVSSNQYAPQENNFENNFKRLSLQDGVLGIYSVSPYTFWEKLRLLFRLRLGNWRDDASLKEWSAKRMILDSKDSEALLSLDGETMMMNLPLEFSVLQKELEMILPKESAV